MLTQRMIDTSAPSKRGIKKRHQQFLSLLYKQHSHTIADKTGRPKDMSLILTQIEHEMESTQILTSSEPDEHFVVDWDKIADQSRESEIYETANMGNM